MVNGRTERYRGLASAALLSVAAAWFLAACGGAAPVGSSAGSRAPTAPPATVPGGASEDAGLLAFSRAAEPAERVPATAAIVAVGPAGGSPRRIAGPALYRTAPAWSPDGRSVAFASRAGIVVTTDGTAELLARCARGCTGFGAPAWSPAGDRLAWGGVAGGVDGLLVAAVADPEPDVLAAMPIVGAPAWSPDGDQLAVIDASGSGSIVIVDAGSGRVSREVGTGEVVVGETVAWSPDGDRLAFDGRMPDGAPAGAGVYVVDLTGSDPRLVTSCSDPGCTDLGPAWSADGSTLAFTRARCDDPGSDCFVGDIATVTLEGGRVREITAGPALDCCAAWRPGAT